MDDLRWGLVGTGFWAHETHAPSIAVTSGASLVAIWGRSADGAGRLAAEWGALPYSDFDEFLSNVDAVSFSVPPDVQSKLALRAIRAGKHVMLEKPIAVSIAAADELVDAAGAAGVSTMVFLTLLFDPRMRAIIADSTAAQWSGGNGLWLGSALMDDNPFNTPWRHDKGALWDLGPHAVSVLLANLGPIVDVTARRGALDLVHATFTHASGASSTTSFTLFASDAADGFSTVLWGPQGRAQLPVDDVDESVALRVALAELVTNIRSGTTEHRCDVAAGRDVVAVLAKIEAAL